MYMLGKIGMDSWLVASVYNIVGISCVPIFIMLSGGMLLDPERGEPIKSFYKKRVYKVLLPAIIWSLLYYLWNTIGGGKSLYLPDLLKGILYDDISYHLWFLYLILGLYLITPLLRLLIKRLPRNLINIILLCWIIAASVLPIFGPFIGIYIQYGTMTSSCYIAYFILGYQLKTSNLRVPLPVLILVAVAGIGLTIYGTYVFTVSSGNIYNSFFQSYIGINVVIISIAQFLAFKRIPNDFSFGLPLVSQVSLSTFGIYLIHEMVISTLNRGFALHILTYDIVYSVPIVASITFLISFIIIYTIKKIPLIRLIVP